MFVVGFSTTNTEESAEKIARALVDEKLAACVNILPGIRSIYKWENDVCDEKEFQLIIKTVDINIEKIKKRILELHHYDVPELIFLDIRDGLSDYLNWIENNT